MPALAGSWKCGAARGVLCALLWAAQSLAAPGESAVITLVFPSGAREAGMGEVGTALADQENVAFYNPAGLGVRNPRWAGGACTWFWEPLLPAFGIRDLWHLHLSGVYQPRNADIGGFAVDWNYINMGRNAFTDEMGRGIISVRSFEWVLTAAWGVDLFDSRNKSIGVTAKLVQSALAPGIGEGSEGVGYTFAIDAGYLWRFGPGFRFGVNLANMGPAIFYINKEQSDPIPFTVNVALAHKYDKMADGHSVLGVASELRLDREMVDRNENDWTESPYPFYKAFVTDQFERDPGETGEEHLREQFQEILVHAGVEVTFVSTWSVRTGFMFDYLGERYEWTFGTGLKLFDHIQVDWSYIYSPEGFMKGLLRKINPAKEGGTGARHGQWRISLTGMNIGHKSRGDLFPWNRLPQMVK